MRTSGEYLDKRIMDQLSGPRRDDFTDHADDDSHGFSSYSTRSSHPNSITEKEWIRFNETLLSLIEKKMEKSKEEVLHAVERISARVSQLETRTRRLENSVDELKDSVECNQGKTEGKLRELEGLLREIRGCTKDISDKQDISQAQVELIKLRATSPEQDESSGGTAHTCPTELSGVQAQPHPLQPPSAPSFHSDVPCITPSAVLPTASPPLPILLHNNHNPFRSSDSSYFRPPASSTSNQPFQVLLPPTPALQQPLPLPMLPNESVCYQPNEFSRVSSQSYQESFHQPFVTPLTSAPSNPVPVRPFEKPFPEPSNANLQQPKEPYYCGGNFPVTNQNIRGLHSSSMWESVGSRPRLTAARALPTASFIDSDSPRHETGNGVPAEEVVDKVVSMGFRRDSVAAAVKRMRERGKPMDVNSVLDVMMNSRDPNQRTRR